MGRTRKKAKRTLSHAQKLSPAAFAQIVKCYAYRLPVEEALSGKQGALRSPASRNTTFRIYGLIRKRLCEIGYYKPESILAEMTESFRNRVLARTAPTLQRRKGMTSETRPYHVSEVMFRVLNSQGGYERQYRQILQLLRLTGPVNKPMNPGIDVSRLLLVYALDRHIDRIRKDEFWFNRFLMKAHKRNGGFNLDDIMRRYHESTQSLQRALELHEELAEQARRGKSAPDILRNPKYRLLENVRFR